MSKNTISQLTTAKKLMIAAGIVILLSATVLVLYTAGLLEIASLKYLDILFNVRGEIEPRSDIVIIGIDAGFKNEFRKTNAPISRKYIGAILKSLVQKKTRIVGFDKLFIKPDWSKGDESFSAVIDASWEKNTSIILASSFDPDVGITESLENFDGYPGIINLEPDKKDSVVRGVPPFFMDADLNLHPTFSAMIVLVKEGLSGEDCGAGVENDNFVFKLGDRLFKQEKMIINFTGGKFHFPYISAYTLVKEPDSIPDLEGKIALVADTTPQSQDFYPVPFRKVSSQLRKKLEAEGFEVGKSNMPGVEIHANAIQSLLDNSWIRPVSRSIITVIIIATGLITGILFFLPKIPTWAASVAGVIIIAGEAVTAQMHFSQFIWFDMVPVFLITVLNLVGGAVYKNLILASTNRKVSNMFGQYVSANIVGKILDEGKDISMSGQTAEVTVLFSDIRGFTPISEKLTPEKIGALLNTYFDRMIKVVFDHDGTLDKLMGDAIMAFYGDPVKFEDHPHKACLTALAMIDSLNKLKNNPPVEGIDMVNIGIGINSGPVTVGDLGSFEYRDYTVIGDNVNLGSRLEGMNKLYHTNIIVSEYTQAKVSDAFEFRKLDAVRVKGKTEPVVIYELLAEKGKLEDQRFECITKYKQALDLYVKAQFAEAESIFRELKDRYGDGPSETFLERCEEFIQNPPPSHWDGVYTATSK
jgi:adenylate cyclase